MNSLGLNIYRCIYKITDDRVLNLLATMPKTEATIIYLRLMRSILQAYVMEDTTVQEKIFHAVFAIHFIRTWRQWLHDSKISIQHFMTQNSWDGLELNLILLLKLALENKAENIYLFNSQNNEAFFRLLRSYTGMESMVVNCSMKSFISRVHKLQIEEQLMHELDCDGEIKFPKLLNREKHVPKAKANLSRVQIEDICQSAINMASNEAHQIGMVVGELKIDLFLKKLTITTENNADNENDTDNDMREDFLNSANDFYNEANIDEMTTDEQFFDGNFREEEELITFQNMTLTSIASGNYIQQIFN